MATNDTNPPGPGYSPPIIPHPKPTAYGLYTAVVATVTLLLTIYLVTQLSGMQRSMADLEKNVAAKGQTVAH